MKNNKQTDGELYKAVYALAKESSQNGTKCPYTGSNALSECSKNTSGCYIAYYDASTGQIVSYKPAGYNRYDQMEIDGKFYSGPVKGMVLEVSVCNDDLSVF